MPSGSLYKSKQWKAIRAKRLYKEPFCRTCTLLNKQTRAWIVDHVIPHKGDTKLFYDYANTQSLCETCHNSLKQSEEVRGFAKVIGQDGWPVDVRHPVNMSPASLSAYTRNGIDRKR